MIRNSPFQQRPPPYCGSITVSLREASSDTLVLIQVALRGLRQVCRTELSYAKAGVDAGLGDGALGVIDNDSTRNITKPCEGMAVTGQPGHRRLIPYNLGVLMPGPAESHDKEPSLANLSGHGINHGAPGPKVHLRGLAGRKNEAHSGIG